MPTASIHVVKQFAAQRQAETFFDMPFCSYDQILKCQVFFFIYLTQPNTVHKVFFFYFCHLIFFMSNEELHVIIILELLCEGKRKTPQSSATLGKHPSQHLVCNAAQRVEFSYLLWFTLWKTQSSLTYLNLQWKTSLSGSECNNKKCC